MHLGAQSVHPKEKRKKVSKNLGWTIIDHTDWLFHYRCRYQFRFVIFKLCLAGLKTKPPVQPSLAIKPYNANIPEANNNLTVDDFSTVCLLLFDFRLEYSLTARFDRLTALQDHGSSTGKAKSNARERDSSTEGTIPFPTVSPMPEIITSVKDPSMTQK